MSLMVRVSQQTCYIGEVARITSEVYGTVVPPIGIPPVEFTTAAELRIQIANFQALEDSTLNTR
jgi:hypothetical protein